MGAQDAPWLKAGRLASHDIRSGWQDPIFWRDRPSNIGPFSSDQSEARREVDMPQGLRYHQRLPGLL